MPRGHIRTISIRTVRLTDCRAFSSQLTISDRVSDPEIYHVVSAARHKTMAAVPRENTSPEVQLRKELFARGYRYRLHDKRLPGSPDVVFPRFKVVVFVHGCFWHRHQGCPRTTSPKTNAEFWA